MAIQLQKGDLQKFWDFCNSPEDMVSILRQVIPKDILNDRNVQRKFQLASCAVCWQMVHLSKDATSVPCILCGEEIADGRVNSNDRWKLWNESKTGNERNDGVEQACRMLISYHNNHSIVLGYVTEVKPDFEKTVGGLNPVCEAIRAVFGELFIAYELPDEAKTPELFSLATACYDDRPGKQCGICRGRGEVMAVENTWSDSPQFYWLRDDVDFEDQPVQVSRRSCPTCKKVGWLYDGILNPVTLGVMADYLEEHGCHGEVLTHLRSAKPKYRGDWAVDLCLRVGA